MLKPDAKLVFIKVKNRTGQKTPPMSSYAMAWANHVLRPLIKTPPTSFHSLCITDVLDHFYSRKETVIWHTIAKLIQSNRQHTYARLTESIAYLSIHWITV